MLIKGGITSFFGPSTLAIHAPRWGAATVMGGTYPVCQWYWCREWRIDPKSGCTAERIKVPRSITWAIFSRPLEIFIPSTFVSIAGKVLRILLTSSPFSKGRYLLGSKVSGAAIPPAIQIRIQESALAFGWITTSFPHAWVPFVASAAVEASPSCLIKSLLWICSGIFMIWYWYYLSNNLKIGLHENQPKQVFDLLGIFGVIGNGL